MGWVIKLHKNARKFLEKLEEKERNKVLNKLKDLKESLEKGVIPWRRLHVRKLKGEWESYFRMRTGKIRIIFEIDIEHNVIWIYNIHYRGGVYKRL